MYLTLPELSFAADIKLDTLGALKAIQSKDCVVIVVHGLYQSPRDMRGLAENMFEAGCNVIAPRLAGHGGIA